MIEISLVKLNSDRNDRSDRVGRRVSKARVSGLQATGKNKINLEIGRGHGHWLSFFAAKECP